MHLLATPLKALSGLGLLALATAGIATLTLGILTLNLPPVHLLQVAANVIDVPVGAVLLPIALIANVIRGVIGTIFHPGAMIRDEYPNRFILDPNDYWKANHNILAGTLVNL